MSLSAQLQEMMQAQRLIRFNCRFETNSVHGYVLDVGPVFFLLALVSDRVWFDGFECFRIADVSNIETDPYTAFVEAALKKRGETLPAKPQIELTRLKELLASVNRAYPLVSIRREEFDADVCWIGRIVGFAPGRVMLLGIQPGARWDEEPTLHKLNDITRISFGGDYENALFLVGGDPRVSPPAAG